MSFFYLRRPIKTTYLVSLRHASTALLGLTLALFQVSVQAAIQYCNAANLCSATYQEREMLDCSTYRGVARSSGGSGKYVCVSGADGIMHQEGLCGPTQALINGQCLTPPTCTASLCNDSTAVSNPLKNMGVPPFDSCAGNPINSGSGNKYQPELDYQGAGEFPLIFERFYNSEPSTFSEALGPGGRWRHHYERSIAQTSDANIVIAYRADGKALTFTQVNNHWLPTADVSVTLLPVSPGGWLLTTEDDGLERYDTAGKLQSITHRSGLSQTLSYDSSTGLLTTVTHSNGRQLRLEYDVGHRIVSLIVPSEAVYRYVYDSAGNLTSVSYPDDTPTVSTDNPKKIYVYAELTNTANVTQPHALTGIIDENGNRFATYQYDAQGRAIVSEHAGGVGRIAMGYGDTGNTITDALNTTRTQHFQIVQGMVKSTGENQPAGAGCLASPSHIGYDANGNIASRTDFNGNLTCYAYDLSRNLETVRVEGIAPGGSCPADLIAYTPAANTVERKIVTAWHPTYRLPAQLDEPGRRTTFAYYANGTLQTQTVTDTVLNKSRAWHYTYDANGQLKAVDGPRLASDVLDVTSFDYYTTATPDHAVGDLWKMTDALGQVTLFTQYDAHGHPLSLTDPNGLVVNLTYDALGRLKTRTVDGHTTTFDYDPAGLLKTLTLPDLSTYRYTYDPAHRLTRIVDSLGNQIDYTLDKMGNLTQQVIKNPDGTVAKTQSAVFDALNRLQQKLGAQNQTTQFTYDANGNLKTTVDPKNHPASVYVYDALDRLKQVQDAAAGITQFVYDGLGQLTEVVSPNNAYTYYEVDALGNQLGETGADRGVLQATYDEAGNRKTLTDSRNITASYTYDALNRLTTLSYPTAGENVTYTYDTGAGCTNGIGRLCRVQDGAGTTTFAYDLLGNLTQQVRTEAGQSYTTGYGYDSVNRISQITGPGNRVVTYGRDAAGRINGVSAPVNGVPTALVSQISTNALGQIAHQTFANGYTENWGYNSDGLATSAVQAVGTGGSGGGAQVHPVTVPLPEWALALMALGLALLGTRYGKPHGKHFALLMVGGIGLLLSGLLYSAAAYAPITLHYDANGNLDQRIDGTGTTNFTYDVLDRLGNETGPLQTQTFGYDGNGNRTSDGAGSYAYLTQTNKLQTALGQSISRDSAGNITGDGVYTYVYNQAGQLAQVKLGVSVVATYRYDYLGRRTQKQIGATTTVYHYDQANHLIAETSSSGAVLRTYVWRNNTPIVQIEQTGTQDQVYYLEVDNLDTPRTARNETGTIIWQWHSDAFGTTAPNEDPDGDGIATRINLRFPGQYYDAETGLHYNLARYYSPALGRYLQSDPIGLAGGMNTFAYVYNNPLRWIDPFGLAICAASGQLITCTDGMRPPPEGTPLNGPLSPVGVAATVAEAALGSCPIGRGVAKGAEGVAIQFGRVENQISHTFRHIEKAGFDRQVVQDAIKQDLGKVANSLSNGQYNGNVVVNGTKLDYSAFKLPDGTINVGRITPPRL